MTTKQDLDAKAAEARQSSIAVFFQQIKNEHATHSLAGLQVGQAKGGMDSAVKSTEGIRTWNEQKQPHEKLEQLLNTKFKNANGDWQGPTQAQVDANFEKINKKKNVLSEKDASPWYCVFLHEMTGFFSLLLWFGAFLCFLGYIISEDKSDKSNLYLGIVLATVTFVTGCFSYFQTSKSAALMAQFKNFVPEQVGVFRNGANIQIDGVDLVPGDVVQIVGGKNIPADVIILNQVDMKVSNASLTGESEELQRNSDPATAPDNIFEAANAAFFGTQCTQGNGIGVVFKTGDDTIIGQIANLASSAEAQETPLSIEIARFIKIVSGVAIFLGVTFFIFGVIYGYDFITNLVFMIGIIVANVPEGLLATVTVSLALTAKRMAKKKVLVKNLESIETLGSTSCICSDKTGTLTQNKMTVSNAYVNGQRIDCSTNFETHTLNQKKGEAKDPKIKIQYDPEDAYFQEFVQALALNTNATFNYSPDLRDQKLFVAVKNGVPVDKIDDEDVKKESDLPAMIEALIKTEKEMPIQERFVVGDASETGLVKFANPLAGDDGDLEAYRKKYPIHTYTSKDTNEEVQCQIPFNSEIKFNLVIREIEGKKIIFCKGAPDKVLKRCSKVIQNGESVDITPEISNQILEENNFYASLGERVLAFAKLELVEDKYYDNYEFDVKNWKNWALKPEIEGNHPGNFPMWGLTLVGLVSLNDPPRFKVDYSVDKCRQAGIKVIMVTGDQPTTAAAIAQKVNIIKSPLAEGYTDLAKQFPEKTEEEVLAMSKNVVVHGDTLAGKHLTEENLDDRDPDKGMYLVNWINVNEVVFARTTPSQKLLIVNACQKAGHVVAVTGDGVNDSPAIKKADIGIAMGTGSDVAKNAADMLLLDDNFSSIVDGVEEGRLIFDNLKKSIAYTLSSNIPEIAPFLFFIIFQVPLPLSTVLILCIDLGTDMVPAISFAYENPELDIMERMPRNSRRDHLVNSKLISFAYLQIGMVQASAGFFTYFTMLNDYGVRPGTTFDLANEKGFFPLSTDVYDGQGWNYGNTNMYSKDMEGKVDWNGRINESLDVRLFYDQRDSLSWSSCRWGDDAPKFWTESLVTGRPICYTIEALKYAQGGYLISIVCVQWADLIICKSRNLSLSQQLMINKFGNFGIFFETALVALLSYVKGLNIGLGTRAVASPHFAIPSFSFFVIIFYYDELRKIYVRNGMFKIDDKSDPQYGQVKLKGWVTRNTYY